MRLTDQPINRQTDQSAGNFSRRKRSRGVAPEASIAEKVFRALTAMGHEIAAEKPVSFGGGQAILKLPRGWAADY